MSDWLKKIFENVKELSSSIDKYKKDTIVQSLPSLTYVNRAKKLIEQKKYDEAEGLLLKALELPQKDALVYKYLGAVYEKTFKNDLAVENYQISADLEPHDKIIWQRLGFSLISVNKYQQAVNAFDNSNKIQAGNSDTFTGWGMALMKLKKYNEAREKFDEAVKYNKYNFMAMFLSAVADIKLKAYDKADTKLSFLLKVVPNESNLFEYARLKAIKNDYENAIFYAKKALEYNSRMLPAYILLGQVYGYIYDKENSLKYYSEAEEKGFTKADLYLEWGKTLQRFEMFNESEEKLLKAYECDDENIEVLSLLGLCYVSQKDFDKASPFLQKVLEKDSKNKAVKQAYGIIKYETGDLKEAISCFKSDDEDSLNCYYLAKCHEKLGNDTKVREFYDISLRINSKNVKVFTDYVNYLLSREDYLEAQRKLRRALKIDKDNIQLLNLMFYTIYILVKDNICEYNVKEALSIAEKIESKGPDLFEYPGQKQELINLLSERE